MSGATKLSRPICNVSKVSGIAFVRMADELWQNRALLVIGDPTFSGLTPDKSFDPVAGGGWYEGNFNFDYDEAIAQVSMTSGTTGQPKAIAISRRAISDTVDRLVRHMELDQSIREYVGVPVTFSFGLARVRAVSAAGGACYLPPDGFRPDELAKMLSDGLVNSFSAVPTMLRSMLLHRTLFESAGQQLRWLEIGSQYMSGDEKKAVCELFPNALILQHYGMTEASRSTFLRVDGTSANDLESVGQAVDEGSVRIGDSGLIEVAGPHLASGIIKDGEVHPLTSSDGWFRTGDRGEIRDGTLFFQGRADDVANVGGIKVSIEFFERELQRAAPQHPVFACVVEDDLRGQKIGIAVRPGRPGSLDTTIRNVAKDFQLQAGDIVVAGVEEVPRTDTGKIRRADLANLIVQAARHREDSSDQHPETYVSMSPTQARIAEIWKEALRVDKVDADDNFHDLGGDSLSAVGVMIRAQQDGIPEDIMQRMFAGETVAEIAAALNGEASSAFATSDHTAPERPGEVRALRADALNSVRGLFAIFIVISHFGPFFIERMGTIGAAIWTVAGPFLRIGTPGFAMAFGMGLGIFFFQQATKSGEHLKKRLHRNSLLLLGGVTALAAMQALSFRITGAGFGPIWPEQLLYGVLLFYLLMVPTSLFWLRQVGRASNPVLASLVLSACAYATYGVCVWLMPQNSFEGWASLGWHMLVAPYAYPRLLGAVALGLAAALYLQATPDSDTLIRRSSTWGLALGLAGFLLVATIPGGWAVNAGSVLAVPAFAGVGLLFFSAAALLMRRRRRPLAMKVAIVSGMLAFPIFIGQALVGPIKTIMHSLGVAEPVAIAVPSIAFLGSMAWMGWKVYRLMFSTAARSRTPQKTGISEGIG